MSDKTQITRSEFQKKMSDTKTTFPCIWCGNYVPMCDMPRVMVCKVCFVRERKKNADTFHNYESWDNYYSIIDER